MHIKVLTRIALFPLDYISTSSAKVGDLISVPFRNKNLTGIVWNECNTLQQIKKTCDLQLFPARISKSMIELIAKTSQYYLSDLGTIAKLVYL